jgi:hypothetical protein
MSTTTGKGQEFVDLVSTIGEYVRRAHALAQQGQDIYGALDIGTWITEAEVDASGNIAGTQVTKAELTAAAQTITGLVAFLQNEVPIQGAHLDNLLRCLGVDALIPG